MTFCFTYILFHSPLFTRQSCIFLKVAFILQLPGFQCDCHVFLLSSCLISCFLSWLGFTDLVSHLVSLNGFLCLRSLPSYKWPLMFLWKMCVREKWDPKMLHWDWAQVVECSEGQWFYCLVCDWLQLRPHNVISVYDGDDSRIQSSWAGSFKVQESWLC